MKKLFQRIKNFAWNIQNTVLCFNLINYTTLGGIFMDQNLYLRLDILKEAGEISQEIKEAVLEFINSFESKYRIVITEENGSMLVTHLSMALSRIIRGEQVNPIDDLIFSEVKQSQIYSELPEFYKKIENKLEIEIPESEKGFIALHACTLINKERKEEM